MLVNQQVGTAAQVEARLDSMVKAGWGVGRTWGFSLGEGLTNGAMGKTVADKDKILETGPGARAARAPTLPASMRPGHALRSLWLLVVMRKRSSRSAVRQAFVWRICGARSVPMSGRAGRAAPMCLRARGGDRGGRVPLTPAAPDGAPGGRAGVYNEEVFASLDWVLDQAAQRKIRIIIPFEARPRPAPRPSAGLCASRLQCGPPARGASAQCGHSMT